MQTKALVFYRGALAHYAVNKEGDHSFKAYLIRYDGKMENAPVNIVTFTLDLQEGSESEDAELVSQLSLVVNQKFSSLAPLQK